MINLLSDKIYVFPFGNIRTNDPTARVLNEQNILKIIQSIVDYDCYVIRYDDEKSVIEFVISGYYFKADLSDSNLLINNQPLYASIKLSENTICSYLLGNDKKENNVDKFTFTGVTFSTSLTDVDQLKSLGFISLQLLDNNHNVPVNSKIKFDSASFSSSYDRIYCGSATELTD